MVEQLKRIEAKKEEITLRYKEAEWNRGKFMFGRQMYS
jgi:hypothetical protein